MDQPKLADVRCETCPGWVNRQFARIERDYKTWPAWMKRETEARIAEARQERVDREAVRVDDKAWKDAAKEIME